jgi:long-chain acyl-CoA synthetase
MVVGDQRPFVAALVTLDQESVAAWLEQQERAAAPVAELREDAALLAELRTAIDAANATVSAAESIKRFRVIGVDFTEADGHLTPTLKLKRDVVMREFAADIEELYARRA